jgi:hypothetical protein
VVVENIKFRPPGFVTAGLPTGIYLDEGSDYAIIRNCRFQGRALNRYAIYGLHPVGNVTIDDCEFLYFNNITTVDGGAIWMPAHAGIACSAWRIRGCTFNSCVHDINIDGRTCLLQGNVHFIQGLKADASYGAVTECAIDLSGTDTFGNVVTGCTFGGAYTDVLYIDSAGTDMWMGNYAAIHTTTAPNGLTVLPAASS